MAVVLIYGLYVRLSIKPKSKTKNQDLASYFKGHFQYYDNLNENDKIKFLRRVTSFIENKNFSGRGGIIVTDQMKALFAGTAIQLTFGLDNFTFDYFEQIIIYPDVYFSPITGRKHKGETNPHGAIVVSWNHFLKGYHIPDDKLNLGLHEMAHALELENRLGQIDDEEFASRYEKFKRLSDKEFERLQNNEDSFLRSYAGTNREEFFAVCVEHFFEAGEEFKKQLPEVYEGMRELLGQDTFK